MKGWKERYITERGEYIRDDRYSIEHSGILFHNQSEFAEFTDIDDDIYIR